MAKVKLENGQMALCFCPDWCETRYQVAFWNGEKFDYPDATNDNFDANVEGYLPLNEDGKPIGRNYKEYKTNYDTSHSIGS